MRTPAGLRLVVGVAAGLLALTACSDGDAPNGSSPTAPAASTGGTGTSTADPAPAPEPSPTPKVGSCHTLSFDAALAPTAEVAGTSCTTSTSVTFHVGKLRKGPDGAPLPVDSDEAQAQIAAACPQQLRKYLGGTKEQRRLSVLTTVWFTPTLEEEQAGADWFRCDLVAPARDQNLMRVSRGMRGAMGTQRAAKYALCGTGKLGTSAFAHVPCGRAHTWRAIATVDLPGQEHPGRSKVADLMESACTDAATAQAADKRNVRWGQEGPTKKQWKAGQRYGVCWVPSG